MQAISDSPEAKSGLWKHGYRVDLNQIVFATSTIGEAGAGARLTQLLGDDLLFGW
jgi:hypothetical protein